MARRGPQESGALHHTVLQRVCNVCLTCLLLPCRLPPGYCGHWRQLCQRCRGPRRHAVLCGWGHMHRQWQHRVCLNLLVVWVVCAASALGGASFLASWLQVSLVLALVCAWHVGQVILWGQFDSSCYFTWCLNQRCEHPLRGWPAVPGKCTCAQALLKSTCQQYNHKSRRGCCSC